MLSSIFAGWTEPAAGRRIYPALCWVHVAQTLDKLLSSIYAGWTEPAAGKRNSPALCWMCVARTLDQLLSSIFAGWTDINGYSTEPAAGRRIYPALCWVPSILYSRHDFYLEPPILNKVLTWSPMLYKVFLSRILYRKFCFST